MSADQTNISSLIRQARQAHPGALQQLLETYRNYLQLLARTAIDRSLRGKADPSDLVQETLFKAHQGFSQFRGQDEPEVAAWLRQILARSLTDLVRRYRLAEGRQVSRERSLEALLDRSSQALSGVIAGSGLSPSQTAQRRELSVVLADALAELSEDHREVIVLRSIEERDWPDVAQQMGRSEGAVRQLWARALKQLRPNIEGRL